MCELTSRIESSIKSSVCTAILTVCHYLSQKENILKYSDCLQQFRCALHLYSLHNVSHEGSYTKYSYQSFFLSWDSVKGNGPASYISHWVKYMYSNKVNRKFHIPRLGHVIVVNLPIMSNRMGNCYYQFRFK